jgi:hypothetical protein
LHPVGRHAWSGASCAEQLHEDSRQFGIDLLVRPEVAVVEIEECLPIDEAARRTLSAAKISNPKNSDPG